MTHAPNRRFTIGRLIKWGLIAFVALVIIAIALARMSVTFQVKKLEQAVRERGEPLTFDELEAWIPDVPDASNAALAILDIWAEEQGEFWHEWRDTGELESTYTAEYDESLPILGSGTTTLPWNDDEVSSARAFLQANDQHRAKLVSALKLPQARFPVHFEDGFYMLLPHLSEVRRESRFLQVEALLALHDNQVNDAISAIELITSVNSTIYSEPILIAQLVYIADLAVVLRTTETILERSDPTPIQLDRLQRLVQGIQPADLKSALIAERTWSMSVFDLPADQLELLTAMDSTPYKLLMPVMRLTGWAAMEKRLMLQTYEDAIAQSDTLTHPASVEIAGVFDAAVRDANRFPPKIMTQLLLPALGTAAEKFVHVETERQLTLLALSIEQYRQSHNEALPASLDALGIELPEFPGLSLGYHPSDNGYSLDATATDGTVYSVQIQYSSETAGPEPVEGDAPDNP